MEKQWKDMSKEERQEIRFQRWMDGPGLEFKSPEAKAEYQAKITRIKDAIQLKKTPDRVPIVPFATFMQTTMTGANPAESMYDIDKMTAALNRYITEFNPDAYSSMFIVPSGKALEALGYIMYKWPGFNLPDQHVYQCLEKEYMTKEDYQTLIDDPSDFYLRTYLPRSFTALEPLSMLPTLIGAMEMPPIAPLLFSLGLPQVQEMLKALLEAGKLAGEWGGRLLALDKEAQESGNVVFTGGFSKAPYDFLGDTLRGSRGIFMDLYRNPDKVIAAVERLTPLAIKLGLSGVAASGNPIVFMPLHKGADGFMSDEQFRTFYWPTLKAVINGLIDEGCVPFLFAEGGYNSRLEYLNEIPAGCTVWLFDRTDMAKAKEVAGKTICLAGNIPISRIMTGTEEDVKANCKELIDTVGVGGGYIMATGCAADEGKYENVQTMINFTKEYGVYK
jgi:hypothetical protein